MGFFDLFKKKPEVTVSFEMSTNANSSYDPWDKRKGNSKTDYSTAVFLSFHRRKPTEFPSSPDFYARYVSYDLGIHNPVKRFGELVKDGYFVEAPLSDTLETLKVVEIKKILEDNCIEAKERKKADLIDKVLAHIPPDKIPVPVMYVLSDKALEFLQENEDLLKLFRNPYGITYEEYMATKGSKEYLSYNDVVWGVFNRREMFLGGNYHEKKINEHYRASFLKSENRPEEALRYYVHSLFLELNDPSRIIPDWARRDWDGTVEQVPSHILENIFEMRQFYVPQMAEECYNFACVKTVLLKKKDFARLLNDIFQGNQIDAKNYIPKGCR